MASRTMWLHLESLINRFRLRHFMFNFHSKPQRITLDSKERKISLYFYTIPATIHLLSLLCVNYFGFGYKSQVSEVVKSLQIMLTGTLGTLGIMFVAFVHSNLICGQDFTNLYSKFTTIHRVICK